MRITSTANPRIKEAARLREHRHRRAQGRSLVDGLRELRHALAHPGRVREVYYLPDACSTPEHGQLLARINEEGIPLIEVSGAVLEKLAYGDRNEGLIAVTDTPRTTLEDWRTMPRELVLVLESMEKPGNVGAVLRTADAVGGALILADARTDLYNPNAIRASLGAVFHVPACEASSAETITWLMTHGYRIMAARVDGSRDYWTCDLRGPVALVLGSEADGLSDTWRRDSIHAIRLPMRGMVDSLNVSVAAAVLAYEWLRQSATRC